MTAIIAYIGFRKVCGGIQVSCPPCIPIVMPGERIDSEAVEALKLYGVGYVEVLD